MGSIIHTVFYSAYGLLAYNANVCVGILRKFDDMVEVILPQLPTSFDAIADPDGKAALIWILGEYAEVYTHTVRFQIVWFQIALETLLFNL